MHLCNYFPHQISGTLKLGVINSSAHWGQPGDGSEWSDLGVNTVGSHEDRGAWERGLHLLPPPQEAFLLCCSQLLPYRNASPVLSDLLSSPEDENPVVYMKYPNFQILAISSVFCFSIPWGPNYYKQVCRLDPDHRPFVCNLWPAKNAWVWLHSLAPPSSPTDPERRTERKCLLSVGWIALSSV